ncbi:MAG: restriction endonuclease subunit S, partial [Chloroflexota bacterium]
MSYDIKFNAYHQYIPVKNALINRIPAHWSATRLKFLLETPLQYGANESAESTEPNQPRYIRITDIDSTGNLRSNTFRSLPESVAEPYILKSGDMLFARSGATVGKTFLYKESWGRACYAGYLIRASVDQTKLIPQFLKYFSLSDAYLGWASSVEIQATIQNISAEKYANLTIPLPDLSEQHAIANFLDRETATTDTLIAKKRELIERLQEKRTALISHAVTKGLDSTVPMRDSGVEWMGEIPAHWEIKRIKHLSFLGNGSTPFRQNETYWKNGTIPWLTSTVVNDMIVQPATQFVTETALAECHLPVVEPNSVLVAITGQGKTRGKAALLQYQATINQHMVYIKPKSYQLNSEFLQFYLSSMYQILRFISEGTGSTKGALTVEQISEFPVALPPLDEQELIVLNLQSNTKQLDKLKIAINKMIEKLQEYRIALISAAVTGKIDVRG